MSQMGKSSQSRIKSRHETGPIFCTAINERLYSLKRTIYLRLSRLLSSSVVFNPIFASGHELAAGVSTCVHNQTTVHLFIMAVFCVVL